MSVCNEISDSLIQEVLECHELASQWSVQMTRESEGTAADHTADHTVAAEEPSLTEEPCADEPVPEHRIPSADAGEHLELPLPLRQLISTKGVKLVAVPDGTWNIDGFAAKLRRSLSVIFSVESVITGEEVFDAFLDAGVQAEDITSIQYRGSNRSWCVSLKSKASKDRILEKGVIHFGNVAVFIGDADFRTVIVKIYEAPLEMPDTVIIRRLSHYGGVLSFRRDIGVAMRVLNGVRTARMRLSSAIPSSLRIAGEAVFVSYPGQTKTCRRCGEEGHMAQGCRKPRCYNCEAPGHVASECGLDPLCGICLQSHHHASKCAYLIFSANIETNLNSTPSTYADVCRQNRPASPATPPPADHQQRKRKADGSKRRSATPDVSRENAGKIRRRESLAKRRREPSEERRRATSEERRREPSEEREHEDRRRERDDRHRNNEDRVEREERRGDRGREGERERRREGHRPRERSERDRGGNRDRRRSPDRRPSHGRLPQLFSSERESDERDRDRRRGRKNH